VSSLNTDNYIANYDDAGIYRLIRRISSARSISPLANAIAAVCSAT